MPAQDEIAYRLSRNALHSLCVSLSFLATLLRCYEYDVELNNWLSQRQQKRLSATEVARRLVLSTARGFQDDKIMSKQTGTKRQILGVARKLPISTVDYLRDLMCNDDEGLQVALTLANLRAIPKRVRPEECLILVKRFIRYYPHCLPSPKPLHPKDVSTQLVQLRRAINELEKFKPLCDYDEIPNEMTTIAERMTCTQLLDIQMQEHAFNKHIIPPHETACRNLVPNGTNHLEIARKRLEKYPKRAVSPQVCSNNLRMIRTLNYHLLIFQIMEARKTVKKRALRPKKPSHRTLNTQTGTMKRTMRDQLNLLQRQRQ